MNDDGLAIASFWQDADSFGWSILALFSVRGGSPDAAPRWGTLDVLTGTANGAEHENGARGEVTGFVTGTCEDAIRRHWHLVDWHPSAQAAHAAIAEARSRRW